MAAGGPRAAEGGGDRPAGSVALVLLSAIGDLVHALPVVRSLRRAWPRCRISWVVQPAGAGLLAGHPDVDEFLVFRRSRGLRGFVEFRRAVADRRFDLAIDLQVYLKAGILTALLDAPRKLGFDRRRARDLNWLFTTERIAPHPPQHVQEQYFEFLHHLGVPVVEEWDFAFDEAERRARDAFFADFGRPVLAVVLRTTKPEKEWPLERWARLLEIAESDLGLQPLIVGSDAPRERAAAAEVTARTRASPVDARRDDLRRLAWLLDGADVMAGPDTGPLHMAAALGTPVVGLYGYTDPKRVGPWGTPSDQVVDRYTRPGETEPSLEPRPGNMERITVREAAEALERAVRRLP